MINSDKTNFLKKILLATMLSFLLASCSTIGLSNPFGSKDKSVSLVPEDAIEYRCDDNKHFHVRTLNKGADAWLMYPDHEVNLTRAENSKTRYTSGAIALELNAENTTLNDGDKVYLACKPQIKKTN